MCVCVRVCLDPGDDGDDDDASKNEPDHRLSVVSHLCVPQPKLTERVNKVKTIEFKIVSPHPGSPVSFQRL